jgi:hypothetical protein
MNALMFDCSIVASSEDRAGLTLGISLTVTGHREQGDLTAGSARWVRRIVEPLLR